MNLTHAEIESLLGKITQGEWILHSEEEYGKQVCHSIGIKGDKKAILETDAGYYNPTINDAEFIAASPAIVKQLLDEVRAYRSMCAGKYKKIVKTENKATDRGILIENHWDSDWEEIDKEAKHLAEEGKEK